MEKLGQKNVYTGKYTKTDIIDIKYESGKISSWEVVSRINNIATVSALVENTTNDTFVLIEQYRVSVNKKVVELVAGICDKNIPNIEIIREEIEEETGYKTNNIELIIVNTPKSPGIISEFSNQYYAKVKGKRGVQNLQGSEEIKVLEFRKTDLYIFLQSKEKEGILISSEIYSIIGNLLARGINILD